MVLLQQPVRLKALHDRITQRIHYPPIFEFQISIIELNQMQCMNLSGIRLISPRMT
jgi:hypothetical protein